MTSNPILQQLYAAREQLLAAAGGDAKKYLAGVREREVKSGRLTSLTEQADARPAPTVPLIDQ